MARGGERGVSLPGHEADAPRWGRGSSAGQGGVPVDGSRFDRLARAVAARRAPRRAGLRLLAAAGLGGLGSLLGSGAAAACRRDRRRCDRDADCCSRRCDARRGRCEGDCPNGQKLCGGRCIPNGRPCGGAPCPAGETPCAGGGCCGAGEVCADGGCVEAAERPNIVFILADDLDAATPERMGRIRQLLRNQGTSFSRFFVSLPSCCPSRASILRGQYAHNHGVLRSSGSNGGDQRWVELGRESSTIATWLRERGYATALMGKYLNGYGSETTPRVAKGWDEWYAATKVTYLDYTLFENGELVPYGDRPRDYMTDVLREKAVDFVRRSAAARRPFLLYVAPKAPHGPLIAADRHKDDFAGEQAPRPPSFDEPDVSDKPTYIKNESALTPAEERAIDVLYRDRLRTMLAVDELVKAVVDALAETGTLANSYVFLTSDNGYLLGEHRRTAKGVPYEESVRVPLLVRGPGVAAGRTEEALALNSDLAATFAEIAGASVPGFVDGRSLLPLLRGEAPPWREVVLQETFDGDDEVQAFDRIGSPSPPATHKALRSADRRYVENEADDGNGIERELYHLDDDPFELDNLANAPEHAEEVAVFAARLAELRGCAAGGCRAAEDAPLAGVSAAAQGGDGGGGAKRERQGRRGR